MNFNDNLYILQTIETVQGEGDLIGKPSLLIRLAGCNCRCPWCDTAWSWNDERADVVLPEEFDMWWENIIAEYDHIPNLMITGGEPLLYKNNPQFLRMIGNDHFNSIEIETNGSMLDAEFIMNLWTNVKLNISPKLDSNWYQSKYGVDYTNIHNVIMALETHENFIFKFVNDPKYADAVEAFIKNQELDPDEVYMMALTPGRKLYTKEHFDKLVKIASLETVRLCIDHGYNYTTRLHLYLWDDELEFIE